MNNTPTADADAEDTPAWEDEPFWHLMDYSPPSIVNEGRYRSVCGKIQRDALWIIHSGQLNSSPRIPPPRRAPMCPDCHEILARFLPANYVINATSPRAMGRPW